ncbi:phosphoheptose isomerase [Candidatus Magnetoovum chiemensis]|nr:phosphoheptose isomerase [Candidatus Magnetoovum chiemensis]
MIERLINEHLKAVELLKENMQNIEAVAQKCLNTLKNGNKIMLAGNGGSAADSQHIAAEIVGRFKKERKGLPAIALTTDTSILTAIGNDYSFAKIFSRQIEAIANKGDLLIAISTSGNSENIIEAVKTSKENGVYTVGLLGNKGGRLKNIVDSSIIVASDNTPRIQECHILIGHIICEIIDTM